MEIKINLAVYKDIFALPACIADDCIKFASRDQFKVIIWLFRHVSDFPNPSTEEIAKALGMDKGEVSDAMEYWIEKGIVIPCSDESKTQVQTENIIPLKPVISKEPIMKVPLLNEKIRRVEAITVNPPTHEELAKRCAQSQDVREIIMTTEQRLGKTLSFSMESTLLMLYDDYGLSVEVIALAVEHLISKKKKVTSADLSRLGRSWCEKEIDTIDKAMEYIENEDAVASVWKEFCERTETKNPRPTKKQRAYLSKWINEFHFSLEMIILAYEEMAEHTNSFNFAYMDKVLESWVKEGAEKESDVSRIKSERLDGYKKTASKAQARHAPAADEASYDLDAYTKKAFSNPMNIFDKKEG